MSADKNWSIEIVCVDCGARFVTQSTGWSVEIQPNNTRMVTAHIPQQCPDCRNLRVVTDLPTSPAT